MLRNVRIRWLFPPVVSIKLKFNSLLGYFFFGYIDIFPDLFWNIELFNILIDHINIFWILHGLKGSWSMVRIWTWSCVCTKLKVFVEIHVGIEKLFESLKRYYCWVVLLSLYKNYIWVSLCKGAVLVYLIQIGIEMVILLESIKVLHIRVRAPICWFNTF